MINFVFAVESKPPENSVFGVPLTMGIINQIGPLITYLNKEESEYTVE